MKETGLSQTTLVPDRSPFLWLTAATEVTVLDRVKLKFVSEEIRRDSVIVLLVPGIGINLAVVRSAIGLMEHVVSGSIRAIPKKDLVSTSGGPLETERA
jgi:hypothetical protein